MIRSLSTAATGMQAQEQKLDQIANDLANMNTTAFKRGRTEFQDLIYQTVKEPGGTPGENEAPVGIQVGSGTRVNAQYSVYDQGPAKITKGLLDMMINGDGFFSVQLPNGQVGYTRDGSFKMGSGGIVTTSAGYPLIPNVVIPPNTAGITIKGNGEMRVLNNQGGEQVIANIQTVAFVNPAALRKIGENLLQGTVASGPPVQGTPGEGGLGPIQQGAVEGSNVKPTESIMDMITTQRGYESNARIMTVGDQMWSTVNNIGK